MRTLTRQELTAALAARQMLLERQRLAPAEAIRRLTPLQGQHSPAPYVALAARLDGFTRDDLEAAFSARSVVKTTIMRLTLHVAAEADYPAYAQLTRQGQMRTWRKTYPHLDEEKVAAELTKWFEEPRTNPEIRERVRAYDGVTAEPWTSVIFARMLLPLVQLPPAGSWDDKRRPLFIVDPRPRPEPADAAALVLARYLAAFGPASRRDVAAWAGVPQRDFADAWARVPTVSYRDEHGHRAARPSRPAAAARVDAAAGAPARALGPAAARLCRPRPDHAARGPAAEADAQRRSDGDRRRPRRRQLACRARGRRRRAHRHAARRDPPRGARRDPCRGQAHRALLRAGRPPVRRYGGACT